MFFDNFILVLNIDIMCMVFTINNTVIKKYKIHSKLNKNVENNEIKI